MSLALSIFLVWRVCEFFGLPPTWRIRFAALPAALPVWLAAGAWSVPVDLGPLGVLLYF